MPIITILFIVTATVIAVFFLLGMLGWRVIEKVHPKQKIQPHERRRDEEASLGVEQRKLYKHAQKLISEKNIKDAARILESIGMVRKSVSILEKNGYVDIAAEILLRINRPHRAGVIYARAGKWDHAVHCFKMAKMPIEVAKCLHTMGRYLEAARMFEKNRDYTNAAQSYRKIHHTRDVARCLHFSGESDQAYEHLKEYLRENLHLHDYNLNRHELRLIEEFMHKSEYTPEVVHALVQENYLGDIIFSLAKDNKMEEASKLYKNADSKAIASMIGQISLGNPHGERLVELFRMNKDRVSLAMAQEKLGQYDVAGKTYEDVGDLIQALSCYSQAGDEDSVQRVSRMIAERKTTKERQSENVLPLESQLSNAGNTQTKRQVLEDCNLFHRLTPEQKRRFWIAGRTSTYKDGQEILAEDAIPKGIFILLSGFATSKQNGQDHRMHAEGECFGHLDLLLNQRTGRSFEAKTTCVVHFIETNELRSMMDKDGRLTRVLFQNAVRMANQKVEPEVVPQQFQAAS